MFKRIQASNFKAVPYLEGTKIMKCHPDGIIFSSEKPNVIIGPNGAGKSAVLNALALKSLSFYTGQSNFDKNFINSTDSDNYWTTENSWSSKTEFLKGLDVDTDLGPALYYRPNHIPGNEKGISHAMMCGYFEEAKAYGTLVRHKSSGQQCLAVQKKVMDALAGNIEDIKYTYINWGYGQGAPEPRDNRFYSGNLDVRADTIKTIYQGALGVPVVMLDEPEQSLDALAEAALWNTIGSADCSILQIIVATHSLYPILHPEKFNIIEAELGYLDRVRAIL